MNDPFLSWGNYPREPQRILSPFWTSELQNLLQEFDSVLPRGQGRSYGDSCLSTNGYLVSTRHFDRFKSFDPRSGILQVEAGVTLEEILNFAVPRGFFLPVTPGTKFVTVGGAVANDIHGKNHHRAGSFGNHVVRFEIWRSDQNSMICSRTENTDLFSATVGGLGLTGILSWIELQLKPIESSWIAQECIKFYSLEDFFSLAEESDRTFEYTVAWIDCLNNNGRGIFYRGNHANRDQVASLATKHTSAKTIPFYPPINTLNPLTVKAFNLIYWNKQLSRKKSFFTHYEPFFYPLDGVHHWNRLYGRNGFLQYQFVLPFTKTSHLALSEIMSNIARSSQGSFLAVLKTFGSIPSDGLISFCRPGVTLALDFPISEKVFSLLNKLDEIVFANGGALYPAKDSRMSKENFVNSFPQWQKFKTFIDPKIKSSFSKRVKLT